MAKERMLRIGAISVNDTDEAALLKFCLHQLLDDDQWVLVIDDNMKCRCEFGIVALEEDVEKIGTILQILDFENIYYETSFELPS